MSVTSYPYLDAAENLLRMRRISRTACMTRSDGAHRLRAVLVIMGTDVNSEPEEGISLRQGTLEQLVRSVHGYLTR